MDDLARIHTFIRVAQVGSFSEAARQLGTSVTSVARQVNSLEEELKVRLIHRSSRKLSLTEPGRLLCERARVISCDLRCALQEAASFQESVKGTLRVSLRPSVGNALIVPALPGFLAQYPELKVQVSLADERCDLIANDIDVAVWMGSIPDSDVIARRLSPGQRIVCASPDYLDRCGVPRIPQDLPQHNCLLFDAPTYGSNWIFSKDGVDHEITVDGQLQTDNGLVLYSAALAGAGLAVAHEWGVRSLVAQGLLVRVLADYTVRYSTTDGALYAVYASNRGLSRKVRAFVDFLVELFHQPAMADASTRSVEQR